jgi:hypothetical protein
LKVLLGPFKHVKIPKISVISKEQRAQKKTTFKFKCQGSLALAAPAEVESSFAHSVSRLVGLDSDCVSESLSREAQSDYICHVKNIYMSYIPTEIRQLIPSWFLVVDSSTQLHVLLTLIMLAHVQNGGHRLIKCGGKGHHGRCTHFG